MEILELYFSGFKYCQVLLSTLRNHFGASEKAKRNLRESASYDRIKLGIPLDAIGLLI